MESCNEYKYFSHTINFIVYGKALQKYKEIYSFINLSIKINCLLVRQIFNIAMRLPSNTISAFYNIQARQLFQIQA